jgi:simple sugar transport system ATP-binding protein
MSSPTAARSLGIETVYQDLAVAPDLDPAANLFLGRELRRRGVLGWLGMLDNKAMRRRAVDEFERLGVRLQNVNVPIGSLSGGQRQSVAVARSVVWASKVVFMDEPTAALGVVQRERVLDVIRKVRDTGLSVVLISHNMPEVLAVSDRVEVLRLGKRVARFTAAEATLEDLVGAMTGALSQEDAA